MIKKGHEDCQITQSTTGALIAGKGELLHGVAWEKPCHECTTKANKDAGIAPDESEEWLDAADRATKAFEEENEDA